MHARIFIVIVALLGAIWTATVVTGRVGAQGVPVLTIEQQLANQRMLINQLQTRLTAVERGGTAGSAKPGASPLAPLRFARPKSALADMTPGLTTLQTQHAQFAKVSGATTPSGPDLAAQVSSLTKEVATLKTELSFDETVIFGELQLVRNNINAVDSDTTTTYGDAVQAAWLACVDYGHQGILFAGWTTLYGTPAPCFAAGN